jgi:hypothetical protein
MRNRSMVLAVISFAALGLIGADLPDSPSAEEELASAAAEAAAATIEPGGGSESSDVSGFDPALPLRPGLPPV